MQFRQENEIDIDQQSIDLLAGFKYAVALANTGEVIDSYRLIGRLGDEYNQDQFNREIKPYLQQLNNDADNIRYLNFAGFAALINSDYREASNQFEQLIKINKDNVWIENYLASCYIELDELDKAEEAINRAREKESTRFSHLLLGVIYYQRGDVVNALFHFAQSGRLFTVLIKETN